MVSFGYSPNAIKSIAIFSVMPPIAAAIIQIINSMSFFPLVWVGDRKSKEYQVSKNGHLVDGRADSFAAEYFYLAIFSIVLVAMKPPIAAAIIQIINSMSFFPPCLGWKRVARASFT